MTNNLYYVNDPEEEIGWLPVVAPTRGSARSIYIDEIGQDSRDPEHFLQPLTINILAHDVDMKCGIDFTVIPEIEFERCGWSAWYQSRFDSPTRRMNVQTYGS